MHLNSASPLSPITLIVSATLSQPLLSTSPSLYLPAGVVRYFLMSHINYHLGFSRALADTLDETLPSAEI